MINNQLSEEELLEVTGGADINDLSLSPQDKYTLMMYIINNNEKLKTELTPYIDNEVGFMLKLASYSSECDAIEKLSAQDREIIWDNRGILLHIAL